MYSLDIFIAWYAKSRAELKNVRQMLMHVYRKVKDLPGGALEYYRYLMLSSVKPFQCLRCLQYTDNNNIVTYFVGSFKDWYFFRSFEPFRALFGEILRERFCVSGDKISNENMKTSV